MGGSRLAPRRWVRWWDRYWFPETTAVRLGVMRIIVVALQLLWFRRDLGTHLDLIRSNQGFVEPQALIRAITAVVPPDAFRSPEVFVGIWWTTTLAGLFALIGLFTRLAVLVFALGSWVLVAHAYSYGEDHHPEAIYCIFLLLLAMAPSGRCLSVDSWLRRRKVIPAAKAGWGRDARFTTATWPLTTVKWLLALAYLSAGLSKLVFGGPDWLNGYTLQGHLLQDAIRWERPIGLWMSQQHALCLIASYCTIIFEIGFPIILFIPRLAPFFLIPGVCFHTSIYVMQAAPFWQFLTLYLVWVPFEKLPEFLGPKEHGESLQRSNAASPRGSVVPATPSLAGVFSSAHGRLIFILSGRRRSGGCPLPRLFGGTWSENLGKWMRIRE